MRLTKNPLKIQKKFWVVWVFVFFCQKMGKIAIGRQNLVRPKCRPRRGAHFVSISRGHVLNKLTTKNGFFRKKKKKISPPLHAPRSPCGQGGHLCPQDLGLFTGPGRGEGPFFRPQGLGGPPQGATKTFSRGLSREAFSQQYFWCHTHPCYLFLLQIGSK